MYGPLASRTKSGVVPTLFRALTGELTPPGIICFACSKAAAEFFLSFMFLVLFRRGPAMESLGTGTRGGLGSPAFFLLFPLFSFFFFFSFLLSYFEMPIFCLLYNLLGIIGDDELGTGTLDGDEALECYTALIEITKLGGCL